VIVEGPNVKARSTQFHADRDPAAFLPEGMNPRMPAANASGSGGLTQRVTE